MTDIELYNFALTKARDLSALNNTLNIRRSIDFLMDYTDKVNLDQILRRSIGDSNRSQSASNTSQTISTVASEKYTPGKGHLKFENLHEEHQNLCRNYRVLNFSEDSMITFITETTQVDVNEELENRIQEWGRMRNLFSACADNDITVDETGGLQPIYMQLLDSLLEGFRLGLKTEAINTTKLHYDESFFLSDVGVGQNFVLEAKRPDRLSHLCGYAEKLQSLSQLLALNLRAGHNVLLCAALDDFTNTFSLFIVDDMLYYMPRVHNLREYLVVTIFRLVALIPANLDAFRHLLAVTADQANGEAPNGDELLRESFFTVASSLGKRERHDEVKGKGAEADDVVDEEYDYVQDSDDDDFERVRKLMIWDKRRRGELYLDEYVLHRREDQSKLSLSQDGSTSGDEYKDELVDETGRDVSLMSKQRRSAAAPQLVK